MNARTEYKRGAQHDTRLLYFNNNDPETENASNPQYHLTYNRLLYDKNVPIKT